LKYFPEIFSSLYVKLLTRSDSKNETFGKFYPEESLFASVAKYSGDVRPMFSFPLHPPSYKKNMRCLAILVECKPFGWHKWWAPALPSPRPLRLKFSNGGDGVKLYAFVKNKWGISILANRNAKQARIMWSSTSLWTKLANLSLPPSALTIKYWLLQLMATKYAIYQQLQSLWWGNLDVTSNACVFKRWQPETVFLVRVSYIAADTRHDVLAYCTKRASLDSTATEALL